MGKTEGIFLNFQCDCHGVASMFILALKVILLDRLQGINCSVIQEP